MCKEYVKVVMEIRSLLSSSLRNLDEFNITLGLNTFRVSPSLSFSAFTLVNYV